jgi:large conductance mechanosensitive channel
VRGFFTEFRKFIAKGNLLQIAVAFILALYFADVINTFTKGIVLPFIAAIFGKPSFDDIGIDIGDSRLLIGTFLNAVINFVLVAFVLFLIVKAYETMLEKMRRSGEETEPLTRGEELLTEIRDLLQTRA